MKPIGYIIYMFWDMKWKWSGDKDWTVEPVSPMPEFKKRIYSTEASAKEAVEQMQKHNGDEYQYFILPIFTQYEEFDKIKDAYFKRKEELKI